MNNKIMLVIAGAIFVLLALYLALELISGGGFVSSIKTMLILAPVILLIFARLQPYWIAIAVCACGVEYSLPIPLFDRLSPWLMVGGAIVLMTGADVALQKKRMNALFDNPASRLIFLLTMIILARVIIDRPSSARFGGTGGAGEALAYLACGFVFWGLSRNAAKGIDWGRNARVIIIGSWLLLAMVVVGVMSRYSATGGMTVIFKTPLWTLSAFLLVKCFNARANRYRSMWSRPLIQYIIIFLVLCSALSSAERAYPLMALGLILCAAFCYRSARRVSINLAIILLPLIISVVIFIPQRIPPGSYRALSIFAPNFAHSLAIKYAPSLAASEFGWQNEFRKTMAEHAWGAIQQNPLIGKGFAFSFDQILSAVYSLSGQGAGLEAALAVAGGYHNGFLSLAYFCGLPAACVGVLAIILISARLFIRLRNMLPTPAKEFGVAVLALEAPFILHLFTQGSGPVWLQVFILLGIANGLMFHIAQDNAKGKEVVT